MLFRSGASGAAVIAWPKAHKHLKLTQAASAAAADWAPVLEPPAEVGSEMVVTNQPSSTVRFYRLEAR